MEKIVFAVDALNPGNDAGEFACYLGLLTRSKITGVFLENVTIDANFVLTDNDNKFYQERKIDEESEVYRIKSTKIEGNIRQFVKKCADKGLQCTIHRDRGEAAEEVLKESRFADILIIDPETSFGRSFQGTPTPFTKNVLRHAECPVIIAPRNFVGISELIFAYDGAVSSVYAIKQFTYLFPQFKDFKTTIAEVFESGQDETTDKRVLLEWLGNHYSNVHFSNLQGDSTTALFDYALQKKEAFLVLGAYGRSTVSNFFNHSHADLLIKVVTQPIFIAHR